MTTTRSASSPTQTAEIPTTLVPRLENDTALSQTIDEDAYIENCNVTNNLSSSDAIQSQIAETHESDDANMDIQTEDTITQMVTSTDNEEDTNTSNGALQQSAPPRRSKRVIVQPARYRKIRLLKPTRRDRVLETLSTCLLRAMSTTQLAC